MKVICAPDSFKESLSAVEAADAMAAGVQRAAPNAEIDRCPVGDGGEGTLESLLQSVDGRTICTVSTDALGRPIKSRFGSLDDGRVAFVESAAAIGLAAIPPHERDVMRSSSYGVGQLILSALDANPEKIIVGVGGTATNDGGCAMAQALGNRFYDSADNLITTPISAALLQDVRRIDCSHRNKRMREVSIVVACDVNSPLTGPDGAACVFAPQKGASERQVELLDDSLRHIAELIRRDLHIDIESIAGAGAAGGLGGGMVAFANADVASGIDTVLETVHFHTRVRNADLCLTGEGALDSQSLAGKACIGVARAASVHNVPTILLAGRIGPGAARSLDAGITEYIAIGDGLSQAQSISRAAELLTRATELACRKYL